MNRKYRLLATLLAGGSVLAAGFASADSDRREEPLPTGSLSLGEIAAQLEADHYRVLAIEPEDRRYEVEVLDGDGRLWEMELDPRNGEVLDRDREEWDDRREGADYDRGDRERPRYDEDDDRGDRERPRYDKDGDRGEHRQERERHRKGHGQDREDDSRERGDRDYAERGMDRSERGMKSPGPMGPRAAGLPASAIVEQMEARGYEVLELERERGVYELEMRNADGFAVEAYLDAHTGEALR